MVRKRIILFLLSLCILNAFGQDKLSFQQQRIIESNVTRILSSFEKYLNLESSTENDMNRLVELEQLFDENAMTSNFLDPAQSKSVQIPAREFMEYVRRNYTSGLSAKLSWDNQKIIFAEIQDMQVNTVYIPVEITAIGIHQSQQILNITDHYFFVFHFMISDAEISGFSLSSIQQNRPPRIRTRKTNNYLGFCISPLSSFIYSKNIFSSSDWDAAGKFGYHIRLQYYYKIKSHFSVLTGIGLSNYKSEYILTDFSNLNDNYIKRVDIDGDNYWAYYTEANIDEWNGLTFIDIPIGMSYNSNEKGLGFNVQAGVNLSFMISSFFNAEGNTTIEGYYPEYSVVLYDIPEYGFTTNPVDETNDWNLNQFQLSAFLSLGIQIPVNDKFTIHTGPYFTFGLNDLVYDKGKHPEDFFNISGEPGKLTTRGVGFRFELLMNL